jgi:hypothetical protein
VFGSIISGIAAAFQAVATALGLIQQNKDQQAGAVAQQAADNAGVIKNAETSEKAADAVTVGGRAAADSVLLRDARAK